MQQAERLGLTQYIGKNVGGIPITMDAIVAMGHLGGMGGARRFLTSGGQDNPSDSFGTSLGDYARRHGNASQPARQVLPAAATPSAMARDEPQQADRRNQLAMMQAMMPRANALDPTAFQSKAAPQNALYGFGAGNNPFVR